MNGKSISLIMCYGLWGWQLLSIKIYYTLNELSSTRATIRATFLLKMCCVEKTQKCSHT